MNEHYGSTQCQACYAQRLVSTHDKNVGTAGCSHCSLGVVNDKLEIMSYTNHLAGEIGDESQFEGITYR